MTAIGRLIHKEPNETIVLNSLVFGSYCMALMLDDFGFEEIWKALDGHMSKHKFSLSEEEKTEIIIMKGYYDDLKPDEQSRYRDKLIAYAQLLQDGHISVAEWDVFMGFS